MFNKPALCLITYIFVAARALIDVPGLDAMQVAEKAMTIAAEMCVYTNSNFVKDSIGFEKDDDVKKDTVRTEPT